MATYKVCLKMVMATHKVCSAKYYDYKQSLFAKDYGHTQSVLHFVQNHVTLDNITLHYGAHLFFVV